MNLIALTLAILITSTPKSDTYPPKSIKDCKSAQTEVKRWRAMLAFMEKSGKGEYTEKELETVSAGIRLHEEYVKVLCGQ